MRIILGNIDGKALGLNASEACVYAVIERCSRGSNAKGWYGTMDALAAAVPCKIDRTTASRAVAKLLTKGLIEEVEHCLLANVQNAQNDVQIAHENVQNALPPAPPYTKEINKEMKEEIKEQPRADMRTRDGAVQPCGFDLINRFTYFKKVWRMAGGDLAEFERRASSLWVEFKEMSEPKRAKIMDELKSQAMAKRTNGNQSPYWKDNPLFFLRDFPEPIPTNYNGCRSLPDEPLVFAKYNDIGGIYTRREAEIFSMNIIKDFTP